MKALRVKEFSERVTDDGEIVLDKAYALPVKYIKDVYRDDEHFYFVLNVYDKCVEEYYREILCELPPSAKKMRWIVVGYERARCRNCFTVFKPTVVRTELHGDVSLFTVCPRCGSGEWDLVTEDYFEVHEQ